MTTITLRTIAMQDQHGRAYQVEEKLQMRQVKELARTVPVPYKWLEFEQEILTPLPHCQWALGSDLILRELDHPADAQ